MTMELIEYLDIGKIITTMIDLESKYKDFKVVSRDRVPVDEDIHYRITFHVPFLHRGEHKFYAQLTPEGVVFSHPEPPQKLIWMLLNKLENCYKLD